MGRARESVEGGESCLKEENSITIGSFPMGKETFRMEIEVGNTVLLHSD